MNNKGFTVVELITTFAVASVIALVLLNVVLLIKNIYSNSNTETSLRISQANLSNQINAKSLSYDIVKVDFCNKSNYCYSITYSNDETIDLIIKTDSITFGNYVYKLEKGYVVDENNIDFRHETDNTVSGNEKDSIFRIKVPVINKSNYSEDFGINYIYLYNNGDIDFTGIEE